MTVTVLRKAKSEFVLIDFRVPFFLTIKVGRGESLSSTYVKAFHVRLIPPSIEISAPVVHSEPGPARVQTMCAISLG